MTDSLIQCIVKIYAGIATCQYADIYNRVCQVASFILVKRSINKILTGFKEHNSVIYLYKLMHNNTNPILLVNIYIYIYIQRDIVNQLSR